MPNLKLIEFLLEHNRHKSEFFCSSDETLARGQYRSKHPTAIAVMKCMDGRLNLSIITKTPQGIIQPFRNLGGVFDLGWPYFGELLNDWVKKAVRRGADCLVLVTYHWSKGSKERGCKGFNYDVKAAKEFTYALKEQVERVFGEGHSTVYPIQVGIETDHDGLLLHGENGETFDMADIKAKDADVLFVQLQNLYPGMKQRMIQDFIPLLIGNLEHIAEVQENKRRMEDVEHKEQILAIGRGFDWLHIPNKALIIGPYSYNLTEPVITAAQLLLDNMNSGRITKKDGIVLMSSAVYKDEAGPERFRAIEKTRSLANFSLDTIRQHVPDLLPHITPLIGIVNANTRLFTVVAPLQ